MFCHLQNRNHINIKRCKQIVEPFIPHHPTKLTIRKLGGSLELSIPTNHTSFVHSEMVILFYLHPLFTSIVVFVKLCESFNILKNNNKAY